MICSLGYEHGFYEASLHWFLIPLRMKMRMMGKICLWNIWLLGLFWICFVHDFGGMDMNWMCVMRI